MHSCRLSVICLPLMALLAGCGSPSAAPVRGKVRFDGKPLTLGQVRLIGDGGTKHAIGRIDHDGNYQIPDAPVGLVKVEVRVPLEATVDYKKSSGNFGSSKGSDLTQQHQDLVQERMGNIRLPTHYLNWKTSGIQFIVHSGKNQQDIELVP